MDADLKEGLRSVSDILGQMRGRHTALYSFVRYSPQLMWVKRYDPDLNKFVMVECSEYYENKLLAGRRYAGKTDDEIWDEETAKVFQRNDMAAIQTERVEVNEGVFSKITGISGVFVGTKWSYVYDGTVYVAGAGVLNDHDGARLA